MYSQHTSIQNFRICLIYADVFTEDEHKGIACKQNESQLPHFRICHSITYEA